MFGASVIIIIKMSNSNNSFVEPASSQVPAAPPNGSAPPILGKRERSDSLTKTLFKICHLFGSGYKMT